MASLIRCFQDIVFPPEGGRTATKIVVPEDYYSASGEILVVTGLVSFFISMIWNKEVFESNSLKDRLGYNNVCVTWDEPPALYIAPIIFAPAIYFSVRYAVLDYIRAAVDPNLAQWKKMLCMFVTCSMH